MDTDARVYLFSRVVIYCVMNSDARNFLRKLDYPVDADEQLRPTIVFLRTPNDFKKVVDSISNQLDVVAEHAQAGDEFLVAFVRNADEVAKVIARYAHKISEDGRFWFVSNRRSLLNDDNQFLPLLNSQFQCAKELVHLKNEYYAKLFQLKDQISNVVNIEHYRTRKREALRDDPNEEERGSIRSPANNGLAARTHQTKNHRQHNLTGLVMKKKD